MERHRNVLYGTMLVSMTAGILTDWPIWIRVITGVCALAVLGSIIYDIYEWMTDI